MNPERRARFAANSFEALIAFLCLLTALRFVFDPNDLDQQRTAALLPGVWLQVWNVLLGVSAFGILAGLWSAKGNWEAAGLLTLCGAMVVQVSAQAVVVGRPAMTGIAVTLAVVLACVGRASQLMKARR